MFKNQQLNKDFVEGSLKGASIHEATDGKGQIQITLDTKSGQKQYHYLTFEDYKHDLYEIILLDNKQIDQYQDEITRTIMERDKMEQRYTYIYVAVMAAAVLVILSWAVIMYYF